MADSFFQRFLFSTVTVYILVSTYTFLTNRREIYPVFNWNLFSVVNQEVTHFFIKVDDKILFGPEVNDFIKLDYPGEYFSKVQQASREFELTGKSTFFDGLKSNFIKRPTSYTLVKAVYNPLELKRDGEIIKEEVIGEFFVE